jgi:hypothetical protein
MVNSNWSSEIQNNTKHENTLYLPYIDKYPIITKEGFIQLSEIHREDSDRNMKKKSVFFLRRTRTHKTYYTIIELGNKCIKKVELDIIPIGNTSDLYRTLLRREGGSGGVSLHYWSVI